MPFVDRVLATHFTLSFPPFWPCLFPANSSSAGQPAFVNCYRYFGSKCYFTAHEKCWDLLGFLFPLCFLGICWAVAIKSRSSPEEGQMEDGCSENKLLFKNWYFIIFTQVTPKYDIQKPPIFFLLCTPPHPLWGMFCVGKSSGECSSAHC